MSAVHFDQLIVNATVSSGVCQGRHFSKLLGSWWSLGF